MNKFRPIHIAILLVFVVVTAKFLSNRHANTIKRNESTLNVLNYRFAWKNLGNGKVSRIPTEKYTWRGWKPEVMQVGSHFKLNDRHWSCKYDTTSVEADEVTISYDLDGQYNSGKGRVKIGYK